MTIFQVFQKTIAGNTQIKKSHGFFFIPKGLGDDYRARAKFILMRQSHGLVHFSAAVIGKTDRVDFAADFQAML